MCELYVAAAADGNKIPVFYFTFLDGSFLKILSSMFY